MGCGGSKGPEDDAAAPVVQKLTDEQDPIGFFAETAAAKSGGVAEETVVPVVKGKCERCGENVMDTHQRDKTEAGNYVHLLPEHCPVLAKEANWQHRKSTFEEEVEDDTQAPMQAGSVNTYNRPKKAPSEAANESEYVALDVTLQNKAEQETYATFEPGG